MECKICGNKKSDVIYKGRIRDGALGNYTQDEVEMIQCRGCHAIYHKNNRGKEFYESCEYREKMGQRTEDYTLLHDKEVLDKLKYTGTDIFRNKIIADVGCGGGSFLDFVSGVASQILGIEPTESFRKRLKQKGYHMYAYVQNALEDYEDKVDIVTSFDVIEHVEDPQKFLEDIYRLLVQGGRAVIGTPTDAPIMRNLLGEVYEKKQLFSTQHLWIFSKKSLHIMAEREGYTKIGFRYFQRYGIGNMLGWVRDKEQGTAVGGKFISDALEGVWCGQLCDREMSDYIVMYLEK